MTKRRFVCRILSLAVLVAGICSLSASGEGEVPKNWNSRFERIDKQLQAGKWKAARSGAIELTDEMAGRLTSREGARYLMAHITTYRAVAEAGLGQLDDAAWYWMMAQNLSPDFGRIQLPDWQQLPNGDSPGAFLRRHLLRRAGEAPPGLDVASLAPDDPRLTPPGPLEAPRPEQPMGLFQQWNDDEIVIEIVVDESGRVVQPVLLEGSLPGNIYRSLEALRAWRFAPARTAGRTVAVLHTVRPASLPPPFGLVMARSETLRPIHRLLLAERWEEAGEAAHQAIDDAFACRDSAATSCDPASLLILRAVAEAGLGREEEAVWHWHMAHNFRHLQPDSLAFYGPAGRLLDEHPRRCATAGEGPCDALDANAPPSGFQPPRIVAAKALALPEALWQSSGLERLVARVVVDEAGRPREPRLLAGRSAAAGYYALQALRDWRFEPARRDGQPVAATFEVTIPLPSSAPAEAIASWRRRLDETETLLLAGQWQPALEASRRLIAEIVDGIRDGGSDLLARTVAQQALAEAGLGREEPAVWHWHMAQNLALQVRYMDLSGYGIAGERLDPHRRRNPDPATATAMPAMAEILEAPDPTYPEYAADLNDFGIFDLLVDEKGRPRAPRIVSGHAPGLLYSAMEGLRGWVFEPPPGGEPAYHRVQMALSAAQPLSKIKAAPNALALVNLAINEARKGDRGIAGCYWQAAIELDPAVGRADLSKLGAAGKTLAAKLAPPRDRWAGKLLSQPWPRHVGGKVQRPIKLSGPQPQYTHAARVRREQGHIIVQATIDEQGYVAGARIVKGLSPDLDLQTIRTMCRWTFQPATIDGRPVAVYYNLITNFSIRMSGP